MESQAFQLGLDNCGRDLFTDPAQDDFQVFVLLAEEGVIINIGFVKKGCGPSVIVRGIRGDPHRIGKIFPPLKSDAATDQQSSDFRPPVFPINDNRRNPHPFRGRGRVPIIGSRVVFVDVISVQHRELIPKLRVGRGFFRFPLR